MSVIAVAAAKSSPGVSTIAELLVALRPKARRCLLLDADPAGGEWLLRPGVASEPGLVSLATVGRRDLAPGELLAHLQTLGDGLEVLVAPAAARQASGALELIGGRLMEHLAALEVLDAVIDCGTLAPTSPSLALVRGADMVVLASHASARAMVHLAPWVEQLVGEGASAMVVLIDQGPACRESVYRPAEVAEALGVEVAGPLAHDAPGAARLIAEPGRAASLSRSALGRSAAPVAEAIFSRLARLRAPDPAPAFQEVLG